MKAIGGKHAVVVGAASGIGRAISLALAREGAGLLLVDIDAGGLAETARLAAERTNDVTTSITDAADRAQVQALADGPVRARGGTDILVNSAGNLYWGPTDRMTAAQWRSVLAVNLYAPVYATLALLPVLLARPEAHIVNVASTAGLMAAYHRSVYSACKFGLVAFSESLRIEYRKTGLGVSVLCPGFVRDTGLFERVMTAPGADGRVPPGWERGFVSAEAVADRAVAAIRGRKGVVMQRRGEHLLWLLKRASPGALERLHGALLRLNVPGIADPGFVRGGVHLP